MPPRRLYEPSPSIPPGLDRADWLAMLDALGREVARIATMGADPQARFPGVGRTSRLAHAAAGLDALWGLDDATAAAADLAGERIVNALADALGDVLGAQDEHAALSVDDLADFMRGAGMPIVADPGVAAAAAARTKTAMLHDWEALEERTRAAVRDGVRGAALSGGGVASVVAAITEAGAMSWARAVLIARTEMADLYDSARFATMRAPENAAVFSGGWWWRARPDACAICQTLHGEVFDVGTDPQRHHQCRCIIVPYTAAAPPPPHRSADDIAAQLPASWPRLDTRDDYRRLVGLRDNRRWRPSHTMRHPDRVAGHPTWAAGPKPRPPAPMGVKPGKPARTPRPTLAVNRDGWAAHARDVHGPPMSAAARAEAAAAKRAEADALRRRADELTRDNERIAADLARNETRPGRDYEANRTRLGREKWQNDNELAGIRFRVTALDNAADLIAAHGYDPAVVAAAREWADRHAVVSGDGWTVKINRADAGIVDDADALRHAAWHAERMCRALDRMPPHLRDRVNTGDIVLTVTEHSAHGPNARAWAFFGTEEAPRLGANPRFLHPDKPEPTYPPPTPEGHGRSWSSDGRAAIGGAESVWVHEFGHILDTGTHAEAETRMDRVGGSAAVEYAVSQYGAKNGREMVAELFADFVAGTVRHDANGYLQRIIDEMGWEG